MAVERNLALQAWSLLSVWYAEADTILPEHLEAVLGLAFRTRHYQVCPTLLLLLLDGRLLVEGHTSHPGAARQVFECASNLASERSVAIEEGQRAALTANVCFMRAWPFLHALRRAGLATEHAVLEATLSTRVATMLFYTDQGLQHGPRSAHALLTRPAISHSHHTIDPATLSGQLEEARRAAAAPLVGRREGSAIAALLRDIGAAGEAALWSFVVDGDAAPLLGQEAAPDGVSVEALAALLIKL